MTDVMETWTLHAAINIKQALPLIKTPVQTINIKAMARRIERKYQNSQHWNRVVNERCTPAVKTLLILTDANAPLKTWDQSF